MNPIWRDPESPWWAKLRRAQKHIEEARARVKEFEQDCPWSIEPEVVNENVITYRFRVHKQVPADIVTIISDAIHNLRTALDTLVYELARQHVGGTLTESQEKATQFRSFRTGSEFDDFYGKARQQALYGPQELAALRCVQPFSFTEEAVQFGVVDDREPDLDYALDTIRRLNALSNIDKHRRLPELGWHYRSCWFASNGEEYRWRHEPSSARHLRDGDVVGYLSSERTTPDVDVNHDVRLVLADDPILDHAVESLAEWHQSLTSWVLPRMIMVAEGNTPSMMIVHQPSGVDSTRTKEAPDNGPA